MNISVYTREPNKDSYPPGLANSVHFALEHEQTGEDATYLNNNYGILFALGEIAEDNTIIPMGVKDLFIFRTDDGDIMIGGTRVYEDGSAVESDLGKKWCWKTTDLMHFEELGLVEEVKPESAFSKITIDDELADRVCRYWNPVSALKADESTQIEDMSKTYPFPLTCGYGDPVLFKWEGKWYFIATNDNLDDIGIYVRESVTVKGLFADDITEHLILPYDPDRHLIQTFWAPEFHVIGGALYILFAVSGETWGPQCHMMKFKKGGKITDPDSWEDPVRVVRSDGTPLTMDAITLDMTYIKAEKASYMVWSYREHIATPMDSGSMLYIATVDDEKPWMLTSEPVLLTRPLYGWENLEGTINNEGPYAFIKDGEVFLAYSGGSANAYTYAVGLLRADIGDNLLDLNSWTKSITPILSYYSVDEFGPGHNSFFTDDNGDLMIAYHGETAIDEHLRCDAIRKVYFKEDGIPFFY